MKDFENILSDEVIINKKYVNKKLSIISSDFDDDGSIVYEMNEHGYRSKSFKDKTEYNILTLGCSWTMGIGVDNDLIWPSLISNRIAENKKLNVSLFNYGMYGVSTSFVSKNYYKIITNYLKPDLVLIMWPGFSRRDYIKEDGSFRKIGGFRMAHDKDVVWKNNEEDILFIQLRNDYQDLMEFWNSYKLIESVSKLYNIKTYHTIAGYYYEIFVSLKKYLNNIIDFDCFFDPYQCYKNDNKARDKYHPGEKWHENFSNNFYEFLKNKI